jgi:hypothetical protein
MWPILLKKTFGNTHRQKVVKEGRDFEKSSSISLCPDKVEWDSQSSKNCQWQKKRLGPRCVPKFSPSILS